MKTMKKILCLVMAMALIAALGVCAFADTATKTITVNNSAKGETYTAYKLFDATYNTATGKVAYTLPSGMTAIPDGLDDYFTVKTENVTVTGGEQDQTVTAQVVEVKDASLLNEDGTFTEAATKAVAAAAYAWATSETNAPSAAATTDGNNPITGTGAAITFNLSDYGYYVIISSQTTKDTRSDVIQAIITDNAPNATATEKSETNPLSGGTKKATNGDVSIGDKAEYEVKVSTANYAGSGANAKQITAYYVKDSMPEFLKDVTIKSITVGDTTLTTSDVASVNVKDGKIAFDSYGTITIPWTNTDGTNKYNNGLTLTVTYEGTVTDKITSGKNAENVNNVTFAYSTATNPPVPTDDDPDPWSETTSTSTSTKIYTYAAAIQKTDSNNKKLAGATFSVYGLTVDKVADGVYNVVTYTQPEAAPTGNETTGWSDAMTCNKEGYLVINGLKSSANLYVKEVAAPEGYNKVDGVFTVKPVEAAYSLNTTNTVTTISYEWTADRDADNNITGYTLNTKTSTTTSEGGTQTVRATNDLSAITAVNVINYTGAELPSTGGMGVTLFYIIGGIMVVGAGVLLITKKRMSANG